KIEEIVDHYAKDGFQLLNLVDRSNGYGCNEFVFAREAPLGTLLDSRVPGGTSLVRRFGHRVLPSVCEEGQYFGQISVDLGDSAEESLWLFVDEALVGPARLVGRGRVELTAAMAGDGVVGICHVVAGELRKADSPFARSRGFMWAWEAADLELRADGIDNASRSTIFVLHDGKQLHPHALHEDITKTGDGRFSHWGRYVYFAPRGNLDPNSAPDRFALFIPIEKRAVITNG